MNTEIKMVKFGEYDFSEFLKKHSKKYLTDMLSKQHDVDAFSFSDSGIWMYRDDLVKLVNSL